jgi:hypothetical protein
MTSHSTTVQIVFLLRESHIDGLLKLGTWTDSIPEDGPCY